MPVEIQRNILILMSSMPEVTFGDIDGHFAITLERFTMVAFVVNLYSSKFLIEPYIFRYSEGLIILDWSLYHSSKNFLFNNFYYKMYFLNKV